MLISSSQKEGYIIDDLQTHHAKGSRYDCTAYRDEASDGRTGI